VSRARSDSPNTEGAAAPAGRRPSIVLEAERRLGSAGYRALLDVRCEYDCGVVRLRGRLPTHYLRQLALALVADVDGVHRIDARLDVDAARAT
jgi:hypothetical protein